jgi:hypothetical protein
VRLVPDVAGPAPSISPRISADAQTSRYCIAGYKRSMRPFLRLAALAGLARALAVDAIT